MKRLVVLALALAFSCIVFVQWGGFSNDFGGFLFTCICVGIGVKAVSVIKEMKKVKKD
jgi:hypothetical protein